MVVITVEFNIEFWVIETEVPTQTLSGVLRQIGIRGHFLGENIQ